MIEFTAYDLTIVAIDQTRDRLIGFEIPETNSSTVVAAHGSLAVLEHAETRQADIVSRVHHSHFAILATATTSRTRRRHFEHVEVAIGCRTKQHVGHLRVPTHLFDVRFDLVRPDERVGRRARGRRVDSQTTWHVTHGHHFAVLIEPHLSDRVGEFLALELAHRRFARIRRVECKHVAEIVLSACGHSISRHVDAKYRALND